MKAAGRAGCFYRVPFHTEHTRAPEKSSSYEALAKAGLRSGTGRERPSSLSHAAITTYNTSANSDDYERMMKNEGRCTHHFPKENRTAANSELANQHLLSESFLQSNSGRK